MIYGVQIERREKMIKIESIAIIAIIIVIIQMICFIVIPRLCFKYTENTLNAIKLINNIFTAEAVLILIVLLMGLIIILRK